MRERTNFQGGVKLHKILYINEYIELLENNSFNDKIHIPTYEECLEICNQDNSPFYESKTIIDGYNVSVFNYRLAQYKDFVRPIENNTKINAFELRGLTFVFNKDGSLYKRFILLEKFFNLNQVPDTMYNIVKNYKIKYVNNKEDGSIASFIKLPNGKIIGRSKTSFNSVQANGVNRIYRTNKDVKNFVDWVMNRNIIPIFEYVSPSNKIVLRYPKEELILLRLRDNETGEHLELKHFLDKLGSIKIAPFEDDLKDLDKLIELTAKQTNKEGYVLTAEDEKGRVFLFKIKTPWYLERHKLLTDDINKENIIIGYILDEKIDDILGQIPADEEEVRNKINKIYYIVKKEINKKIKDIENLYQKFLDMGKDKKEYALKYKDDPNFSYVMSMINRGTDPYELAKKYIRDKTKRLKMAREWLLSIDSSFNFVDIDDE